MQAYAAALAPTVKTHPARAARIAVMHTWLTAQSDGWWRMEFDRLKVPFDYINTQTVAASAPGGLRAKYDVIIFPPGIRNAQAVVNGLADVRKSAALESNAADAESGKDRRNRRYAPRPGLGGLERLQEFVRHGGLLITANDSDKFRRDFRVRARRQHRRRIGTEGHRVGAAVQDWSMRPARSSTVTPIIWRSSRRILRC